ncbi:MAG TPA: type II toxin-antitoxin system VapC family toxin [Dehalococcoidia bacterium]|nr:type II toxin-antitoxin system VapC family toxin [Dehalococcoidia bacterium]
MSDYVLDSSALLAMINGEPGGVAVEALTEDEAIISSVNLCEVVTKLVDNGFSDEQIDEALHAFTLSVLGFDQEQALRTGLLREQTRPFGLSLGDRACLNLARNLGRTALTADRLWIDVPGVAVELFR